MTTRQAELINIMLSQHYNSATYKDAYSELRGTCSDALVQPTVTVSASGTANPPPPSTPQPLGPEWWKERQAEAIKEQIEIIADQNKKITELQKQIERMEIQQCVDAKTIKDLKASQAASVTASNQILGSLNQTNLRQYDGSLADNVVDVIKQCVLQGKQIGVMNMDLIRKDKEIGKLTQWHADSIDQVNKLGRELGQKIQENERLKKELEVAGKKQKAIIKAGNDLKYLLRDVFPNDYPLMYDGISYCTHYISLWDDNTTPQSSAG